MLLKIVLPRLSTLWGTSRSDLCNLLCYFFNLGLILRNGMALLYVRFASKNFQFFHLCTIHYFHTVCLKVNCTYRNQGFRILTTEQPYMSNVTWLVSNHLTPVLGLWTLASVQHDLPLGCCATCWSRLILLCEHPRRTNFWARHWPLKLQISFEAWTASSFSEGFWTS